MSNELGILLITAGSIGFFHTLLGPDHYLPFVVMSRAGKWPLSKTTLVTMLCGTGHVMSSTILGLIGVALGISITKLEGIESIRGDIAAWALIVFGLVYFIWGIYRGKNQHHHHLHTNEGYEKKSVPWALFTVFLFGPCEPLIPLLMYPAAQISFVGMAMVVLVFAVVTLVTMLGIVLLLTKNRIHIPEKKIEKYNHALAGFTVLACGLAIQFGDL